MYKVREDPAGWSASLWGINNKFQETILARAFQVIPSNYLKSFIDCQNCILLLSTNTNNIC